MAKLNFTEIILICLFGAQVTFLIIINALYREHLKCLFTHAKTHESSETPIIFVKFTNTTFYEPHKTFIKIHQATSN